MSSTEPRDPCRRVDHEGLQITLCGGADAGLVAAAIQEHERAGGEAVLKESARARVTAHPGFDPPLCVKRYAPQGALGLLAGTGLSRAARAWRGLLALREAGIPAAEPIALVRPAGPGPGPSWLLTRLIPGAEGAYPCYCRLAAGRDRGSRRERGRLIELSARLLAKLHSHGLYHPDLSPQNLVVERDPDGRVAAVRLVDLDAWPPAIWPIGGRLTRRRRIKNLAQLGNLRPDIRARDKRRFALIYQRASGEPLSAAEWARVRKAIALRAM